MSYISGGGGGDGVGPRETHRSGEGVRRVAEELGHVVAAQQHLGL
jgi:hypothetical protein